MIDLHALFTDANALDASDVHLQTGLAPRLRIHGELRTIEGTAELTRADLDQLVLDTLSGAQQQRLAEEGEVDTACVDGSGTRYRVNFFRQHAGVGAALRRIPSRIQTLRELAIPPEVEQLAKLRRGLVLVTGATGSGKSSTLAALIDVINQNEMRHVVTLEDPIEFVHARARALIQQRAVYDDAPDFPTGVRDALRADVDVLLVGELRDLETMRAALTAAETGMVVYATLHTNDAAQTVDRVIDIFPVVEQSQVRAMLAESLCAVLSQVLLKRKGGAGRVPATELMLVNPAISAIIRDGKSHEIANAIQAGRAKGMHRLDDSLERLMREGTIERDEAAAVARSRARFDGGKKPGSIPAPEPGAPAPPTTWRRPQPQ